jgi:AraC-like DNA-binding protein
MTASVKDLTLGLKRTGAGSARAPSISAGFARGLMELAVRQGANRAELAARAGIVPHVLEDQDARISLSTYVMLMRAAKELTNDPALALHFGEAYQTDELSIVGLIGLSCETWAEAFAQLARYGQLIADVPVDDPQGRRLVLQHERGKVWIVDTRSDPDEFPELTESSFARMAAAVHRKRAPVDVIRAIHVTHKPPPYAAEYARVFELPVVFESDRNALLADDGSFLRTPIPRPSRYVFGVLSERADALLKELDAATTTRGRVESLLLPALHTGEACMDAIAHRMALSRPTLARRLKAEGTTFEKVLDELRHHLALVYLEGRKISINEAAYLVGFSEPAAFSRAFKRWTGKSPNAMRDARPLRGTVSAD